MMIINGFGAIIWPMYIMLGQICGQDLMKISSDLTLVIGWDEVLHQEIAKIISCLESYPKLTAVYRGWRASHLF
jgi:hypothetical protein